MIYNVNPGSIQKSFYGKCFVYIPADNSKIVLFSYNTPILTQTKDGVIRHWDAWSQTTGRHVKAFCGLSKKEYEALPYKKYKCETTTEYTEIRNHGKRSY